jgi:hypothetical protein
MEASIGELVACEYMSLMQYTSKYEKNMLNCCPFLTRNKGKSQRSQISKGKITRVILSFHSKVNTVNCSSQNRGRCYLRFEIIGAKSQSEKIGSKSPLHYITGAR